MLRDELSTKIKKFLKENRLEKVREAIDEYIERQDNFNRALDVIADVLYCALLKNRTVTQKVADRVVRTVNEVLTVDDVFKVICVFQMFKYVYSRQLQKYVILNFNTSVDIEDFLEVYKLYYFETTSYVSYDELDDDFLSYLCWVGYSKFYFDLWSEEEILEKFNKVGQPVKLLLLKSINCPISVLVEMSNEDISDGCVKDILFNHPRLPAVVKLKLSAEINE